MCVVYNGALLVTNGFKEEREGEVGGTMVVWTTGGWSCGCKCRFVARGPSVFEKNSYLFPGRIN